ncbi:cryptochrome/photolyase family protein [Halobaculum sp. D14]|uniref:cryptochrome/photolyase family protein n=1 Tax=Halobaculum sp. D14 TaxID=3421642 RepID=UPI003EBE6740
MRLFWHRRDLRGPDNRGLTAAATGRDYGSDADDHADADPGGDADGEVDVDRDGDAVLPVFVVDDDLLEYAGAPRVRFMLDALSSLREWYRARDADLLVVRGDPADELPRVADEHGADAVYWNRDYSGLARRRDDAVRDALDDAGVAHRCFHDAVLHEPGSITTNDGDPYAVYSYFWRKWRDRPKDDPVPAPDADSLVAADDAGAVPSMGDLGFSEPDADVQAAGTEAARDRLSAFCADDIYRYDDARDYPAERATSRLSADLKWGTVGIREVYAATADAKAAVAGGDADADADGDDTDADDADGDESGDDADERAAAVEEFQSQLAWREFYTQVLWANPRVVAENYREYEHGIEWRADDEALQQWKDGETGYPIVDAGMRQLREEAHVHNRVRMVVASFLTKDLRLDWRRGYAHFRELLADHDAANDSGGWQWAASTGTDAQPYFRIFNPASQCERYDPDAEYVRQYVPELRGVDAADVHDWPTLDADERDRLAPDYPDPVVDHSEAREAALAMFEAARGDDEDE